jgi:hypothetical protein
MAEAKTALVGLIQDARDKKGHWEQLQEVWRVWMCLCL